MNDIYRRKYVLEFDVWEPQRKVVDAEFDQLMFDLKNKHVLPHTEYLKIALVEEIRVRKTEPTE